MKKKLMFLTVVLLMIVSICSCGIEKPLDQDIGANNVEDMPPKEPPTFESVEIPENHPIVFEEEDEEDAQTQVTESNDPFSLRQIPEYSGNDFYVINENVPFFSPQELTTKSYEYYGDLDALGRCTVTHACIGQDIMPTEKRGEIGMIKPTGWHTVKYDCVEGKYLYNRSHLIGYQLTGENANEKNLITGSRYFNVQGMLPFENMVADYVKETGNHVMYRVTPIFNGNNLLAHGVIMEAFSVEDDGAGICFNVFVYNIQPGVTLDYATGASWLTNENAVFDTADQKNENSEEIHDYVLNKNSHKFHNPSCESVSKMSDKNREDYHGTREDLIAQGYEPCGSCKP